MADWLKILDDEIRAGNKMRKQVPKMLSDPEITLDQVTALFGALEKQAQFVEKLKAALEALGHDFPVVDKARALEGRYVDLAATRGGKAEGNAGVSGPPTSVRNRRHLFASELMP